MCVCVCVFATFDAFQGYLLLLWLPCLTALVVYVVFQVCVCVCIYTHMHMYAYVYTHVVGVFVSWLTALVVYVVFQDHMMHVSLMEIIYPFFIFVVIGMYHSTISGYEHPKLQVLLLLLVVLLVL